MPRPLENRRMRFRPPEDRRSFADLKKNLRAVFRQIHETGRPVVVTIDGKSDIVLVNAAVSERKLHAINLAALLAKGEEDICRGRTRLARAVFVELRRGQRSPR